MTIRRPHRTRCAMFTALAATLTLVPASGARGETLTWAQVKARAAARSPATVEAKQGAIAARQISAAVTRAKSAVDASWAALARWQAIAPRLDEAQAMVEKGYAAGQVDLFDTLASAERVARARVQILEARAAYLKARAELSRALGEEP